MSLRDPYGPAQVWLRVGRPVDDTIRSGLHEIGHLVSVGTPVDDRERVADAWRDHLAAETRTGRPSSWFADARTLADAAEDQRIESNRAWVASERQRAASRAAVIAAEILSVEAEIRGYGRRDGAKRKAAEARLAALNEERLLVAGQYRSLP